MKKTKRYAGEGRSVNEAGRRFMSRPLWLCKSIFYRLIGRKINAGSMLNRDFYAAITSDHNYLILGEERYGLASRMASLKKAKPTPPKKK